MADEINGPLKEEPLNINDFVSPPSSKTKSPTTLTSELNITPTPSEQEKNTNYQQQPDYNSQVYQQQLQEALLAFDSHGMSQSLIAAAAAAMVSSTCPPTSLHQHQPSSSEQSQQEHRRQHQTQQQKNYDLAKRESIRTANRERKKKWRIHNEERNKDNDLRCRVNKRASKLFGVEESEAKTLWAEEEFNKRREKRQEKERRKDVVNNVLSNPPLQHQHQHQQQQSAAAAAAAAANAAADDLAHSFAAYPSVFDASKLLEIPSELQRHLLEQLNLALTNSKLPTSPIDYTINTTTDPSSDPSSSAPIPASSSSSSPPPSSSTPIQMEKEAAGTTINEVDPKGDPGDTLTNDEQDESNQNKKQEYPIDAVLTLMQLNAGWKK